MRKIIFILSLILVIAFPAMSSAFFMPKDVNIGTYYYDPVRTAINGKIIGEVSYFYPARVLTRAQFVGWFVSSIGLVKITPVTPSFSDVPETYPLYSAIETAKKYGLVSGTQNANGTPTGKFEPDAPVNRAQAAVIIMKAFVHLQELGNTYPDIDDVWWAKDSIRRATAAQFFSGYPNGTFGPANSILRSEGITVFMKIYSKMLAKQLGTSFAQ